MKLALGTAQFGLSYGVANSRGQVSEREVREILITAAKAGLHVLDTAIAYGNSEVCLGSVGVNDWNIVTKLPALPHDVSNVEQWVQQQILASLERLKVSTLEGVLLHRPADLLGDYRQPYLAALQSLKDMHLAKRIGVSIYSPVELDALWPIFQPDIVQTPLNVLDRRLIRSGWMQRLHDAGVHIHTRSAFLQGLLLMPASHRPRYFDRWNHLFCQWVEWCSTNNYSPSEAALAYALNQQCVEQVIVGVDSVGQLEELLAITQKQVCEPPQDLFTEDVDLLNPSHWKLQ